MGIKATPLSTILPHLMPHDTVEASVIASLTVQGFVFVFAVYKGEFMDDQRHGLGIMQVYPMLGSQSSYQVLSDDGDFSRLIAKRCSVKAWPTSVTGVMASGMDQVRHALVFSPLIDSVKSYLAVRPYIAVLCVHILGVERFILMGNSVESLVFYDNGNCVGRERIDIENGDNVTDLKRGSIFVSLALQSGRVRISGYVRDDCYAIVPPGFPTASPNP